MYINNNISHFTPMVTAQRVHVLSTPGNKHLFGVHRQTKQDTYVSHVLGFRDQQHALTIAKSLETYHRKTGNFPPREVTTQMDFGMNVDQDIELHHVAVEEVDLMQLMQRMRGTGIVVTVLSRDPDNTDRLVFKCRDIRADTTTKAIVHTLNRTYWGYDGEVACTPTADELLPKPIWSPLLAITATTTATAAAAANPRRLTTNNRDTVAVHFLAACFIKCLALVEVLAVFWLLPTLFKTPPAQ